MYIPKMDQLTSSLNSLVPQELRLFVLLLTADDDLLMQLSATWQLMSGPFECNLATEGWCS